MAKCLIDLAYWKSNTYLVVQDVSSSAEVRRNQGPIEKGPAECPHCDYNCWNLVSWFQLKRLNYYRKPLAKAKQKCTQKASENSQTVERASKDTLMGFFSSKLYL